MLEQPTSRFVFVSPEGMGEGEGEGVGVGGLKMTHAMTAAAKRKAIRTAAAARPIALSWKRFSSLTLVTAVILYTPAIGQVNAPVMML
jgi:hypothetical protein